jgi:hypothetical protein
MFTLRLTCAFDWVTDAASIKQEASIPKINFFIVSSSKLNCDLFLSDYQTIPSTHN